MGGMHRETKDFQVSDPRFMRGVFDGGDIDGTDVLEKTFAQIPAIEKFANSLISRLLALPRTNDTWGLIHNDLHQNNFLVKANKVYAFDFDDSIYGYFALDIGIATLFSLRRAMRELMTATNLAKGNLLQNTMAINKKYSVANRGFYDD